MLKLSEKFTKYLISLPLANLCFCVPCEVDDGEEWEVVTSGVPVVCDGGVVVGAIVTAYHHVDESRNI